MRAGTRSGSAAALLTLLLQLLFVSLTPVADARVEAQDAGAAHCVQIERPGLHHAVHDPDDCVFCIALQLGAAPAAPASVPAPSSAQPLEAVAYAATGYVPAPRTLQVARAPPAV